MIKYNPKDWFTFIFRFHKADTFRKLMPIMLAIALYCGVIDYLEVEYFNLSQNSNIKNITIMHGMLGFVISLLLAYRTNTAYDRWWEGRKLWGALVNNSRNLAMKLSVMLSKEDSEQRSFFRKIIPAYAFALHNHLRAEKTRNALFETDEHNHILTQIDKEKHIPNQIALLMFSHIQQLYTDKKIDGSQLIVLNSELQ